ncbi:hypothetical protein DXA07_06245 [Clostridium sp. AM54-37XD]|nr:hypothetical protein DXA07_06245 [Clostridium sp. AM54-37XD]RHP95702.1 hypothetical protein DXA00_09010 [Clostridium sp. AM54-14XD]
MPVNTGACLSRRRVGTGVFTNRAFTSNRKHSRSFTMWLRCLLQCRSFGVKLHKNNWIFCINRMRYLVFMLGVRYNETICLYSRKRCRIT